MKMTKFQTKTYRHRANVFLICIKLTFSDFQKIHQVLYFSFRFKPTNVMLSGFGNIFYKRNMMVYLYRILC